MLGLVKARRNEACSDKVHLALTSKDLSGGPTETPIPSDDRFGQESSFSTPDPAVFEDAFQFVLSPLSPGVATAPLWLDPLAGPGSRSFYHFPWLPSGRHFIFLIRFLTFLS